MKIMKTLLAVAGLGLVAACSTQADCSSSDYCNSASSCVAKVALGEDCSILDVKNWEKASFMCSGTNVCISMKCAVPILNGQSCSASESCVAGSFCTNAIGATSPVCETKAASGNSCADTSQDTTTQCVDGTYCTAAGQSDGTSGTCAATKATGETCDYTVECTPGGLISCSSNTCRDIGAELGAAVGAAVGMAGGILAAVIIIPICVCICCCVIIYKVVSKGKGDD